VEAAGIEREDTNPQCIESQQLKNSLAKVSALCLHGSVTKCHLLAVADAQLSRVIEIWQMLPEVTRQTIFALCADTDLIRE
jgi:hypothetical protein